jgi:TRAP-type C4-dicarboxylate transport system permease small subunit
LSWTLEVTLLAYLWTIFVGSSFSLKNSENICFSLVYDKMSPRVKRFFDLFNSILTVVFLVVALPETTRFVRFMKIQKTSMLELRYDFVYLIFIVFMLALIFKSLACIFPFLGKGTKKDCTL